LPEVVSDTSPLQYLHQLDLLYVLPALGGRIIVPPSVEREISIGRSLGFELPDLAGLDWVEIRSPESRPALPLINDLGPGETETLMLALESPEALALLDDLLARRVAEILKIRFTGTLGLLLDAKRTGLVPTVRPLLARLQALGFRVSPHTRLTILELAGEEAESSMG
jgi:predicted nucleic acid-binding protein